MARRPRQDEPDSWHHVMNRGIARRTVFEDRDCVRYFLSRLAYSVRRLELEVHAYSLITTHFHLLVRTPNGCMGQGMRRIQNEYVRWFNRRYRRDGPLFRGRFISRPVETLSYQRILVGYIDRNATEAGLAHSPEAHEHGSARHYAHGTGPPWLSRDWVEGESTLHAGQSSFTWDAYRRAFLDCTHDDDELVRRRLVHPAMEPDPLDDLVGAAPPTVLSWMRRKAALADGTRPGLPSASATSVQRACERERSTGAPWAAPASGNDKADLWSVLEVGLLRDLSGLRWDEIAQRIGCSAAAVKRRYQRHGSELAGSGTYPIKVQALAAEVIAGRR